MNEDTKQIAIVATAVVVTILGIIGMLYMVGSQNRDKTLQIIKLCQEKPNNKICENSKVY